MKKVLKKIKDVFQPAPEELEAHEVLEEVYENIFRERAQEIEFPRSFYSEVGRDNMKCSGMAERYMVYKKGKIVLLENKPWIISLGTAGREDLRVSRDLMILQTRSPEDIERDVSYFSHSLVHSLTDSSLFIPVYGRYSQKLSGILEGTENFVFNERKIESLNTSPIYGLSVLTASRTYKPTTGSLLSRRIEARLQLIAEQVLSK
mgnify:CR=1 FL=1